MIVYNLNLNIIEMYGKSAVRGIRRKFTDAFKTVLVDHHKRTMAGHFERSAITKYAGYNQKKAGSKSGGRPMVCWGQLRKKILSPQNYNKKSGRITGKFTRSGEVRVTMRMPIGRPDVRSVSWKALDAKAAAIAKKKKTSFEEERKRLGYKVGYGPKNKAYFQTALTATTADERSKIGKDLMRRIKFILLDSGRKIDKKRRIG